MSFKVVFMGTPDFAVPALAALQASSHQVVGVFSQPPKAKGRGHKVQLTPVHAYAQAAGLPCLTPARLRNNPESIAQLRNLAPDIIVVVAYGLILPPEVLEIPPRGCVNIHGSLLPRWRGAAPLQRALLAGDAVTGITTMQMDAGLDTGDMLLRASTPIGPDETFETLHDRMAALGADLIIKTLDEWDQMIPQKQPEQGVTYAEKVQKDEGRLDWTQPAEIILRQIAALNPWPGTYTLYQGQPLHIRAARLEESTGTPGALLDHGLLVACGSQALRIEKLQRPGGRVLSARDFLNGLPLAPPQRFD